MERILRVMHALLFEFQVHNHSLYEIGTTYAMQFLLHFLADVLHEMNELNIYFQKEDMDITQISLKLDVKYCFYVHDI